MFPKHAKPMILVAALAVSAAVAVGAVPSPMLIGPDVSDATIESDPSLTETYCDSRRVVEANLERDFAEEPRLIAVTGAGMTMELWASDLMGTWTMLHHGSDGISCIVTSGHDWTAETDAVLFMDSTLAETVHQS